MHPTGSPSDGIPRRIAMWVEYQGSNYNGFQLQVNHPTIQAALEEALYLFTGEKIRIRGASRTDSGAHALGQVVDFLTVSRHATDKFPAALNYFLADDIRILSAAVVPESFNSRRSAQSRAYRYRILARPEPSALCRFTHFWVREQLGLELMQEAAMELIGTHDFRVISPGHPGDRSAVRTVSRWDIRRETETVVIECEADGFLKQQIRKTNGILLEIGKRKQPPGSMRRVLEGSVEIQDFPILPAKGLCLVEVKYPEEAFEFLPASGR